MKKVITLLVALLLMIMSSVASAANINDFPRVAVMPFGNKAITSQGLQTGDFAMCSEYAIYQLLASGWFDLIDYEQLNNIAKMHNINMSGQVDQSTAVEMGRIAGAQFMVVGNVTGLTVKETMLGVETPKNGSISGNKHTVTANVMMRIVDIETGRIIAAGMGNGSSSSTSQEIAFKLYRKNKNSGSSEGVGGGGDSEETDSTQTNVIENSNDGKTEQTETNNDVQNSDGKGDEGSSNDTSSSNVEYTNNTYTVKIGAVSISDIQIRNALGKAVRDAVYGRTGLMTMLNGGKPMKIKTGF